jgi:hypothetical protein
MQICPLLLGKKEEIMSAGNKTVREMMIVNKPVTPFAILKYVFSLTQAPKAINLKGRQKGRDSNSVFYS